MDRGAGHRYQIMRTSVDKRVLHRIIKLKDLMGTTTFFFFFIYQRTLSCEPFLWQNYCDILGIRLVGYVNSTSAYYYMFCLDSIIILFLVQCFNHSLYIYIYIYM